MTKNGCSYAQVMSMTSHPKIQWSVLFLAVAVGVSCVPWKTAWAQGTCEDPFSCESAVHAEQAAIAATAVEVQKALAQTDVALNVFFESLALTLNQLAGQIQGVEQMGAVQDNYRADAESINRRKDMLVEVGTEAARIYQPTPEVCVAVTSAHDQVVSDLVAAGYEQQLAEQKTQEALLVAMKTGAPAAALAKESLRISLFGANNPTASKRLAHTRYPFSKDALAGNDLLAAQHYADLMQAPPVSYPKGDQLKSTDGLRAAAAADKVLAHNSLIYHPYAESIAVRAVPKNGPKNGRQVEVLQDLPAGTVGDYASALQMSKAQSAYFKNVNVMAQTSMRSEEDMIRIMNAALANVITTLGHILRQQETESHIMAALLLNANERNSEDIARLYPVSRQVPLGGN